MDTSLLEAIVSLAGYSSTTFLDIFKSYNAVLEANGLDPADDVQYYRFILKLGMIPGLNWGERWERWKLEREGGGGPSSPSRLSTTTRSSSPVQSTRSLPASSYGYEREEAPQQQQQGREEDVLFEEESWEEEEEGASSSSALSRLATEDSYSTLAVGYRPHSQGRRSNGSISPPQRTSTPLATRSTRNRGRPRTSTPPPPPPRERSSSSRSYSSTTPNYPPPLPSSSEYSHPATPLHLHTPTPHRLSPSIPAFLLPSPPDDNEPSSRHQPPSKQPRKDPLHQHSNHLNGTRSSPKPSRTARPPAAKGAAAKVPKLVSESRALIEAELQREDEERERRREDERRGDRFYELGLLGRCWDVWRRGREWVLTTSSQIDKARTHLLLSSSLSRWRHRLSSLRTLESLASAHYSSALLARTFDDWLYVTEFERDLYRRVGMDEENRLVGKTWLRWRKSWDTRRKGRWEESLLSREGEVKGWVEERVLREAVQHWRSLRLTLVATSHHELTTLRSTFNWWRSLANHVSSLDVREREWEVSSAERIKSTFFDAWRSEKLLREQQRVTEERVAGRIMGESWESWKGAMELKHAGDQLRRKNLLRFGLRGFLRGLDGLNNLNAIASNHLASTNCPLLHRVLKSWRVQTKGRILELTVADQEQARSFDLWRDRLHHREFLAHRIQTFQHSSSQLLLARTLSTWRSTRLRRQASLLNADRLHSSSLLSSSFRAWGALVAKKKKEREMADVAHEFLLKRRTWLVWNERLRGRERDAWVLRREEGVMGGVLDVWVEKTRRRRLLRDLEGRLTGHLDQLVQLQFVANWRSRLARLRAANEEAALAYNHRLVAGAFAKWTDGCLKHGEQLSLMQSFRDVKVEDNIRKTFSRWLVASRRSRQRKADDLEFARRQRLELLSRTWALWIDRHREARLRPLESQLTLLHSRNVLDAALYTWEARSNIAAAIHFDKVRLKKMVLRRMRDEFPRAKERNAALARERSQVLSRTFDLWRRKTKAKVASRPPPRLRGITRARPRLSPFSSVDRSRTLNSPSPGRD